MKGKHGKGGAYKAHSKGQTGSREKSGRGGGTSGNGSVRVSPGAAPKRKGKGRLTQP